MTELQHIEGRFEGLGLFEFILGRFVQVGVRIGLGARELIGQVFLSDIMGRKRHVRRC